jgi:rsbT co-antagonist protein RsbR
MNQHASLLQTHQSTLLEQWLAKQHTTGNRLATVTTADERSRLSKRMLDAMLKTMETEDTVDVESPSFAPVREVLTEVSVDFAERGLTPSETATYIFSLKEVFFDLYRRELKDQDLIDMIWRISQIIDGLGLFTFETFGIARERIIKSQAQALTELSTPVIQVWDGIVALPLVGTVDSARAKEIMENLLDAVVTKGADVVIIDITGVPVVDTQVANRLMRTVEAVRLLGTSSIITGINPVIAQTLVQLGVDLSQLSTKATLRAGLQQAFRDLKLKVVKAEAKR